MSTLLLALLIIQSVNLISYDFFMIFFVRFILI